MTEQVKTKDKSKKRKEKNELSEDTNKIVQFLEIVFVVLIIFLIVTSEVQLISIHVFYSNIGWMLLMVQGLLVFRGINPLFRKILGKDQQFIHWVVETIALIGASIGFACAYNHKEQNNKAHFTTWHATFGLIGFSLCIITGLNGVPTLYRKELKDIYSPTLNKFIHFLTGTLGFFFGGLSLILACYSNWFVKRTSMSFVTFMVAICLVISVVTWTLIQPMRKVRGLYRRLTSEE